MLLNEMEIFYYVASLSSFSKAAEKLGSSKSYVSKRITRLEESLQARLLSRSTRKLTLTEAGEQFYQYCSQVVDSASRGISIISELQGVPRGTLKVSMPPALGLNVLVKWLPYFTRQYPDIHCQIELSNHLVDVIKEGYDVVLRSAKLESSSLVAQRLFSFNTLICATPQYLKLHGELSHPNDLEKHNIAIYSQGRSSRQLTLEKKTTKITIPLSGDFSSNSLDLIKSMMLSDTCLAVLPDFMLVNEVKSNKVTRCFEQYDVPSSDLYAIYPEREFMPPKVKVFVSSLKTYLSDAIT